MSQLEIHSLKQIEVLKGNSVSLIKRVLEHQQKDNYGRKIVKAIEDKFMVDNIDELSIILSKL